MRTGALLILVLAGAAALVAASRLDGTAQGLATWQQHAMPGKLSEAHASMKADCAACHTAVEGAADTKCIGCHANNVSVLQRQPTAFHGSIGSCARCHIEHQGGNGNLRKMDHTVLAQIGLRQLGASGRENDARDRTDLLHWMRQHPSIDSPTASHPLVTPIEMTLDCKTCHATTEPHAGLFGQECASCHGTTEWTIATFNHPSSGSLDCAQCHQAPPSHYMEHFSMVSKTVAGQTDALVAQCCGPVQVNQCYRCHQTTSWNDIKGVGWYKHH
jgi:hypothetical protein